MRVVIARCQVDYAGKLAAHLPMATRVLMIKADGSVLVHSDGGSYKPLNWMSPPCTIVVATDEEDRTEWLVESKSGDTLRIVIDEVIADHAYELGIDPGLQKDGVEKHLQELLADHPSSVSTGLTLVQREYPTAIGPIDLLCRDTVAVEVEGDDEVVGADSPEATALDRPRHWAVEVKRKATIDAVEQLSRYVELLNRDPLLAPVGGVLAAQTIAPQARTLAENRGFRCVVLDYDALRGMESTDLRLF